MSAEIRERDLVTVGRLFRYLAKGLRQRCDLLVAFLHAMRFMKLGQR